MAALAALIVLSVAPTLEAGFSGTDVFIPASARAAGAAPSQFYSTLWVTNLSTSAFANVQLKFFQRDTSNTSPITIPVVIAPGETKKYENVVQTVFGLPSASGAIRVQSDQEILVSSRTYNLPPGSDIRDANGLFFTGIPQSLSVGSGETSQLQGVSQGGAEDFRYNFGMVETTGNPVTVRIVVRNSDGSALGTKDYPVQAYEAKQFGIADAAPGISTSNGRVEGSVIAGSGAVLLYGTAVANGSQDSIGFEMSYRNTLLSTGVTSLNTFTGAITIAAGSGIAVSSSIGNQIVISATGGGGGGGTAGVSSLNSLTGPVTLSAGSNVSITPSGNNLIFASTGGGLTLPYTGNAAAAGGAGAFNVSTTGSVGQSYAIFGSTTSTAASAYSAAVRGASASTNGNGIGVWGSHAGGGWGVYGNSATGWGVYGSSGASNGVYGASQTAEGVYGYSGADNGVTGQAAASTGAYGMYGRQGAASGLSDSNHRGGVWGDTTDGQGVLGTSKNNIGVSGMTTGASAYGVQAATLAASATSYALAAFALGSGSKAGYFSGAVTVAGALSKSSGSFKIDHPVEPETKYLYHSFVESPDMMNIYNGMIALDAKGEAVVQLPSWFSALNRDFRYQLTCVGGYAPVYVSRELEGTSFQIAGGKPGLKVSWQLTGVRQDAWANAHRVPVEEMKSEAERGYFLHPELFNQPEEKGIEWANHPEAMKQLKQLRERAAELQK